MSLLDLPKPPACLPRGRIESPLGADEPDEDAPALPAHHTKYGDVAEACRALRVRFNAHDVADACGLARNVVAQYLFRLEVRGLLRVVGTGRTNPAKGGRAFKIYDWIGGGAR